jgi:hypothetical protein
MRETRQKLPQLQQNSRWNGAQFEVRTNMGAGSSTLRQSSANNYTIGTVGSQRQCCRYGNGTENTRSHSCRQTCFEIEAVHCGVG